MNIIRIGKNRYKHNYYLVDDDLLRTGGVTKTLNDESILPTDVQSSEM